MSDVKLETTRKRHEEIRKQMDSEVYKWRRIGVRDPVACACKELCDTLCYTEQTLRKIYYGY